MHRQAINAEGAATVGPYSHAVRSGDLLYLSGQTPLLPDTGQLIDGDVEVQTEQCFRNLFKVLQAAGLSPDDVVKVNVYLTDMKNFEAMNSAYSKQFNQPFPARTTIGVKELPKGAAVEIELIARFS